jgi:GNAT superfamily N-acetyltransferase
MATPADADAIAELMDVLGYPTSAAEVRDRLSRMNTDSIVVLVADIDGRAAGVVTGHVVYSIHSTPGVAWLTTLAVSERHQRQGIGASLTRALEEWARNKGAIRVSLTSGLQRAGAHSFYEGLGYERTGVRLTKPLRAGAMAYPVAGGSAKRSGT